MFIVKDDNQKKQADIRIVGVGGGGNNALETMIKEGVKGVQFIAVNTDNQALEASSAGVKVQIGSKITKGLGAGANPEVGRRAAVESYEEIVKVLKGADMVFVTAGMGGGTGTGAAPFVAQAAKELDLLTVGIVTKPFIFEGYKRMSQAKKGIGELTQHVDTLIVIPNEQLLNLAEKDTPLLEAFKLTDDVLLQAVKGIAELVSVPGLINLDFADIKTVMKDKGMALMGRGTAKGPDRAQKAIQSAVSSPLLSGVLIKGATGMIVNLTSDSSLSLMELNSASSLLTEMADPSADIIVGTVIDEKMNGELSVTVIATGFENQEPLFDQKNFLKAKALGHGFSSETHTELQSSEDSSHTEDASLINSQATVNLKEENSDPNGNSEFSTESPPSKTSKEESTENSDSVENFQSSTEELILKTSKEKNSEAIDLTGATQSSTEQLASKNPDSHKDSPSLTGEQDLKNPERETQDKENPQNFNISADSQSAKENLSSTSSKEKKSESINFSKNSQSIEGELAQSQQEAKLQADSDDSLGKDSQDSAKETSSSQSQQEAKLQADSDDSLGKDSKDSAKETSSSQSQQEAKLQAESDDPLGKDSKDSARETSSFKEDSSQDKTSTDPSNEPFNHSISSNKESINKKEVSLRESLLSKAKAYQASLTKKKSKRDDHQIDMEWPKKQEELSSPFEADLEFSDEDML